MKCCLHSLTCKDTHQQQQQCGTVIAALTKLSAQGKTSMGRKKLLAHDVTIGAELYGASCF